MLKTNIIFFNNHELNEALTCGAIPEHFLSVKDVGSFPYMLLKNSGGQIFSTWNKKSVIDKVLQAKCWSDVRDDYPKPKWFNRSANAGKIVWVRNNENQTWSVDIFGRFDKGSSAFICERNYWNYAKPLDPHESEMVGTDGK